MNARGRVETTTLHVERLWGFKPCFYILNGRALRPQIVQQRRAEWIWNGLRIANQRVEDIPFTINNLSGHFLTTPARAAKTRTHLEILCYCSVSDAQPLNHRNRTLAPAEEHIPTRSKLAGILILLVLLASTWLIWSGLFQPLLLSLGVVSVALCLWIALRMDLFDDYLFALPAGPRLLRYWLWLAWEVVTTSITVARIVLSPSLPITPCVARVRSSSPHPYDTVIFANSITLTPGTLSMDVDEGVVTVHSLTREGMRDVIDGDMNRRVAALRGSQACISR